MELTEPVHITILRAWLLLASMNIDYYNETSSNNMSFRFCSVADNAPDNAAMFRICKEF